VAFSPDGKRIASGSWDDTVKVWDAANGQETLSLKRHSGAVMSVAFSPDGKRIASSGRDGTVKLWDAASGQETLSLKGHSMPVGSVAFSPDGKRLASGSEDQTVKLWDAATGLETLSLAGYGRVTTLAFSPDGKRLASASYDHTVKVWDAASGQQTLTLKVQNCRVASVAFSPDGKRLASGGAEGGFFFAEGIVKVWEAAAPSEEDLRKRRAVVIVRELFQTLDSQPEVIAHLREDRFISEPFKSELIALAKAQRLDPLELNKKSWEVVRQVNSDAAARERALRQAREACRLEPDNGLYLNTLGVALYRAGQYQAALETLTRSEKLNTAAFKTVVPADLAFQAMAQQRLGKKEAAQQSLARLRQAAKSPRWANDAESQAFLHEAETLVQGPK
jgi:dipeptidyl aminopeptidase/acylaminoacyl peptidase